MDLQQNYLSYEPLQFFKDFLLKTKDHKKIQEEFFNRPLTFGTAGLRGIMQPGINGINGFTIAQSTTALAQYLKKLHPHKTLTVCISYDNRHHSMQFAEIAARALAHFGIYVKLAAHLRPTPWLSFAVRQLKADAGIMITASHNPKIYNGFKVYLSDGGQIVAPHDKAISDIIKKTDSFSLASSHDSHIELIEKSIDDLYIHALKTKLQVESNANLKIIYSPLCGTGAYIIPQALKSMGFLNIDYIQEEMIIDPEFAGIATPNPETDVATFRSCKKLMESHSDIALISDPDADRIGLIVMHKNKAIKFTGNEIAALILDYLIETTENVSSKIVVSSFVTSRILNLMCAANKITHIETLTGFKYIGQVIENLEENHEEERFLFGAEESCGYLIGTHAKDKDAIIISAVLAKAAQIDKSRGLTLYDRLLSIYKKYGISVEETRSLEFPIGTGSELISKKIQPLLNKPPTTIFDEPVTCIINYNTQEMLDPLSNTKSLSQLPKTDAAGFFSLNGWLIVRPSGTEAKLKVYAGLMSKTDGNAQELKQIQTEKLSKFLNKFCQTYLG